MKPLGSGLARLALRAVGGRRVTADRIVDDLTEEWRDARGRAEAPRGHTGRRPTVWFWAQVARALPPLVGRRLQRRRSARNGATDAWVADLAAAARRLRRAPGFLAAGAGILALGIGANAALFSVVQAVVLAPLPYEAPDRIFRAWADSEARAIDRFSFRVAEHDRLVEAGAPFTAVGGEFAITVTVDSEDGAPARVDARMVTPDFFQVFGVTPAVGRIFGPEDVAGGDRALVVVSHDFWRTRLGADPEVLGRGVSIDGRDHRVVGVLPAGYVHVSGSDVDLFVPHTLGTEGWIGRWLDLYVRLAPGADPDAAAADASAVMRAVAEAGDTRSQGWRATLQPLDAVVLGEVRPLVWLLFAAVGLLLLVACVSVAGLVLARSALRVGEIRIRHALGAGRGRLVRESFFETMLLAAAGWLAGVAVAHVALDVLLALVPPGVPRLGDVVVDGRVLLFSGMAAAMAGVGVGLAPAVRGTAPAPADRLVGGTRGELSDRGTGRLLRVLVVVQVALTLVLTAGAGLLVRSVANLDARDLGFDPGPALTYRVALPEARYRTAEDIAAFVERYLARVEAMPGVDAAGAAADLPLSGQGAVATVRSAADVAADAEEGRAVLQRRASPGLFGALGVAVLEGRVFDGSEEATGEPVVVLSRSLAAALFPAGSAVGGRVTFRRDPAEGDWRTVLGVVEDVQYVSADGVARPQLYEALVQSPVRDVAVVLRGDLSRFAALAVAAGALRDLDPGVPLHTVHTLEELRDRSTARRRFALALFATFAALSMALTGAGLYGVLALAVRGRRSEIGLRMALGAGRPGVVGGVVGDAARLTAVGIAAGLVVAWGSQDLLGRLLYGVAPLDPAVMGATALLTLGVALAAAWVPARRAAAVDPGHSLRGG